MAIEDCCCKVEQSYRLAYIIGSLIMYVSSVECEDESIG